MSNEIVYVQRALNNNAALASDGTSQYVLIGRRVGFRAKAGESLRLDESENTYRLLDSVTKAHYIDMINRVDPQVLTLFQAQST